MYIYMDIYIYICENEIWNLSPMKHQAFSSESARSPTFWILPKLTRFWQDPKCRRPSTF